MGGDVDLCVQGQNQQMWLKRAKSLVKIENFKKIAKVQSCPEAMMKTGQGLSLDHWERIRGTRNLFYIEIIWLDWTQLHSGDFDGSPTLAGKCGILENFARCS